MGKLLDDSSALQDILNLDMHDEEGCHIFHLVCRSPEKPSDVCGNFLQKSFLFARIL